MGFIWKLVKRICKGIWLTLRFIREMLLNLILILLLIAVLGVFSTSEYKLANRSALLINLTGVIVDNPQTETLAQIWLNEALGNTDDMLRETSIFELTDKIKAAKNDPQITGLILSLNSFRGANPANLQALGEAIVDFKESNKPVLAYADSYSQQSYYLASFANEIFMAPYGAVDIHGMATNNLYFKSLLDKLSINTHVFRVGTYKSAVEPFIRDDMSPEAKEANSLWLNTLWDNYLKQVAQNRNMEKSQFFSNADKLLSDLKSVNGDRGNLAVKLDWVDQLADRVMMNAEIENRFGINPHNKQANVIEFADYNPLELASQITAKQNIAVITVEGTLIDGRSSTGMVGAETIAEQIREARADKAIKALILRINSPGGSVSAAELIYSELMAFKLSNKPIVVSFGGLAASGGYWVAAPADYIFANENTLTGSIGIFGVISTFENTLGQIGVSTDGVSTSPLADISISKTLPDQVKNMMQISVDNGYQRFLSIVSTGRNMTIDQVDNIAQGRVWSGLDALKIGLVDEIGNFNSAIEKTRELAKLDSANLYWYTDSSSLFQQLTSILNASISGELKSIIPTSVYSLMKEASTYDALLNVPNNSQGKLLSVCLTCSNL